MRRRKLGLVAILGPLLFCMSCGAGSVAFREGRKAELRHDYDTALVDYETAVRTEPDNARYLLHERQMRIKASIFHLNHGQRLLKEGRANEAIGEFQKAVSIDPSNQAAAQELGKLLAVQAAEKKARETRLRKALQSQEKTATLGLVKLKSMPTEPLAHFRISADSKKVFETLGKLAGLNVAFTYDFQPRPVSLDLSNVKIRDALNILADQTRTFWKAITPNTILVVPDTPTNRRDYENQVVKTIYLSNPLSPADRTAITTALKQILSLQRVVDNPDANAIVVRDTPEKVAAAERIVQDLDRNKAEILIEVTVLEADADRVRDLGLNTTQALTFPSPFPPGTQSALGFNPRSSTTVSGLTGIPLNQLGHLSTADFSLVLPGAVATALLNDSRTRILQNPEIRVTDGETAKLRIGSRVPYATGSFLPSFGGSVSGGTGTSSFGLLASTQFQYQDVGVNLDITPHLLSDGEVALHAKIEISALGPSFQIGGLSEPSFTQRVIDHDIRLKESEVSLLGGLMETTTTRVTSGLPGLGRIPGLRYFFSTESNEKVETEVLVMLTPEVIRLPQGNSIAAVSAPRTSGPVAPRPSRPAKPAPKAAVPQK